MIQVKLQSEIILPGTFQLQGCGDLGNLSEFVGSPDPLAPAAGFPASPFQHGNLIQNRLIHTDQPWEVKLSWTVGGIMAHCVDPRFVWEIEVLLEQWGFNEFAFPPRSGKTTVNYGSGTVAGSGPTQTISYPGSNATTVSIPAGTIPAGVYSVVAVLRLLEADGQTPCFLAAFAEFGKIDFYDGH